MVKGKDKVVESVLRRRAERRAREQLERRAKEQLEVKVEELSKAPLPVEEKKVEVASLLPALSDRWVVWSGKVRNSRMCKGKRCNPDGDRLDCKVCFEREAK